MPMNTKTVTSMVLRTCSKRLASGMPWPPQKFTVKRFAWNANANRIMNTRIGTTFATVTIVLMKAACCTPRRIVKWKIHIPNEATAMAAGVLPSPNNGKKAPRVDLIRTQ